MDCSTPGLPIPHHLSEFAQVKVKLLSCSWLFATPWTVAYQAPPSIGFSRQEYWSGLPFPSPGDLPNPGIKPGSPALQTDALPSEPSGKHLPKFMFIATVMLSSHLILWQSLLPLIFPSIRDFSDESSICIRGAKYWTFNFSVSPSSEYSGLISFKTDWFNLLAVQGTFRSLLKLEKASIFGLLPSSRSSSDNRTGPLEIA